MKLRYRCYILTPQGTPLVGATIWFTPRTTGSPIQPVPGTGFGIQATEVIPAGASTGIGEYEVIVNPLVGGFNSANIAKLYDVWQDQGASVYEQIYDQRYIGTWQWKVTVGVAIAIPDVGVTVDYDNVLLIDSFGDALPETIPNATVIVARHYVDRQCYISAVTTTSFTINPSAGGVDTPIVDLIITLN
jgi:hypothetical protein